MVEFSQFSACLSDASLHAGLLGLKSKCVQLVELREFAGTKQIE